MSLIPNVDHKLKKCKNLNFLPLTAVHQSHDELSYNELKDAHWLYDTPGIIKEHDVRFSVCQSSYSQRTCELTWKKPHPLTVLVRGLMSDDVETMNCI